MLVLPTLETDVLGPNADNASKVGAVQQFEDKATWVKNRLIRPIWQPEYRGQRHNPKPQNQSNV